MVWKLLTLNCYVQLLIQHLYISFIFDAQLLWVWHFWNRNGGDNRDLLGSSTSYVSFSMAAVCCWGLGVLGYGLFSFVFLSNEVHEPRGMHYTLICFASFQSFRL